MLELYQKSVILQPDFFKVDNNPQTRLYKRRGIEKRYE